MPKKTIQRKMGKKQRDFITMFEKKALNISATCKAMNIDRTTFYEWCGRIPDFQKAVEQAREGFKDWVESQIVQCMNEKDKTMLIFYAKTQMKDRGYIERQEIEHSGDMSVNVSINISDKAKKMYDKKR